MAGARSINHSFAEAARMRTALRTFAKRTEEITSRHGLSPQRYTLLLLVKVAEDEGSRATVTSLVGSLQTTQSSVTQLVGGAVQAGLIARTGDERDARRHYLHVTPEGLVRLRHAFAELGQERARLAEVVTPKGSAA